MFISKTEGMKLKKKKNRVLGFLLILVCIAGLIAVPVMASETKEIQDAEENVQEEGASPEIESAEETKSEELEIAVPEENDPETADSAETDADSVSSESTADPEAPEDIIESSSENDVQESQTEKTSGDDDEVFATGETAGIRWTLMKSGTVILEDGTVYEAVYPSKEAVAARENSEMATGQPLLKAAPKRQMLRSAARPDEVPDSFSGTGTVTWRDAGSESSYFTLGGLSGIPNGAVNAPDAVATHCADHTAAAPYEGMVCSYTATLESWDASTGTATYYVYATPPGATDGVTSNEFGLIGYQHLAGTLTLNFAVDGTLQVKKESADPSVTNGDTSYSLAGAEFKVYEDEACTVQAESGDGTTVTFTTDANGNSEAVSLPSGTYYVKEIKAPANFKLNETVYSVTVGSSADAVVTIQDAPVVNGGVKVKKKDRQGDAAQGDASLSGSVFTIYDSAGSAVKTITSGSDGIASTGSTDLSEGSYTVQETAAPAGYLLNSSWKESFQVKENGKTVDLTGKACEDQVIRGGVNIQKTDADLKTVSPQGDAALSGAVYTITNKSAARVYVDGKWYNSGAAVKTITTNEQGIAQTAADLLPYGTYEIAETTASSGYRVNNGWKQTFQIREDGKVVDLAGKACEESVIRGGVKIKKQDSVRKNNQPQGDAYLAGAKYSIVNKSSKAVVVGGTSYTNGKVCLTITTDATGLAQSAADALPYGTYEITETDPSAGYLKNSSWKQSFTIRENGKVVDLTGKPCEEEIIKGGVKIQKTDADLKKAQAQGDASLTKATFAITNKSKESVIVDGKSYAAGAVVKTLTCNDSGVAKTSADALPYGTYEITETDPSTGYRINSSWKQSFTIRENGKIVDLTGSSCEEPVIRGGVLLKKQDDDYKDDVSQGDAALKDAEFTITNKSKASVMVGGKEYTPDEDVITIKTDDAGIAQTASDALPYGTYEIRETKPSEGYLLNEDWNQTFEIRENGKVIDLTEEPCDEKVIRGGVLVEKRDLELDRNEALGGASLAGIEFTVTNASPLRVWVNGESFDPEAMITAVYTDEEGHASLPEDCLPYGTYTIQETKTNESYLLTNGEPRTFMILEDKEIVKIDAGEEELIFRDQVVRNDFHFNKIADSSNARMGKTAFVVTQLKTGEQHVIVTDRNGVYNSKSKANPHSQNTNGNDFVLEKYAGGKDIIPSEELDHKAGLWFGLGQEGSEASVQDGLGALPYGDYRMQELRCESNIGYKLLDICFYVETDQTVEPVIDLGTLTDDEEEKPEIRTSAVADGTGVHETQAGKTTTIIDTVTYKNLKPGTEYTLHGTLMIVPDGAAEAKELLVNGVPIKAEKTFTPDNPDGTVEMTFVFDSTALAGTKTVVFEEVRKGSLVIAAHADAEDEGQQVGIIDIGTTAVDEESGTHGSEAEKKDVFIDTVSYTGLTPGKKYEVKGVLMDADTGKELLVNGKTITAKQDFVPGKPDGTVEVEFTLDTRDLVGKRTVVFEDLYRDGIKIAVHADIKDEDQTVTIVEIGTTAFDLKTGTNESEATEKAIFVDTVFYKGLVPGKAYTVKGVLMDADTGKELLVNEKPVTAEKEFTPEKADDSISLEFTLNTKDLAGKTTVIFEDLYQNGKNIASHADIKDENQSITIIEIGTKATDKASGTQEAEPSGQTTIVDTVEYTGLAKGKTYVVKGVLMDQETGEALRSGNEPITAEKEFKAKKADGSVELEFTFDSSVLAGRSVVVFEDLYHDGTKVASHADLNDKDQTVTFKTPEPTPTPTPEPEEPTPTETPTPSPTVTPTATPTVTPTPTRVPITSTPAAESQKGTALKASPVKTGDNSKTAMYLIILLIAGIGGGGLTLLRLKRR